MPSSRSVTQAQYKSILWRRLNAWPNPSFTADAPWCAQLLFKCKNFQRTGAFKFRGAFNTLSKFEVAQRRAEPTAFLGGNHAQGFARSARLPNMQVLIVMPKDASAAKLASTRSHGIEVMRYDRFFDDREELERDMTITPSYDHPDVVAGHGTAKKEFIDYTDPLELLYVRPGGGGFISGSALAIRLPGPQCKTYGVEPKVGNDGQLSLRSGRVVHIPVPQIIADGAQTQHMGEYTFGIIQRDVDDILTVSHAQLAEAMRFFDERVKMVVEPTGCLAFACACRDPEAIRGARAGVIVSGVNVDLARYAGALVAH